MRYCQFVLCILSTVPLASFAIPPSPPWGDKRVKHAWKTTPDNWESLGPPPAGTTIDLYIALKPHRESALIDALIEVSNPRHQKYGAHLSKEQVAELVAPHQETLELAHSWLEHYGIPSSSISRSHDGSWLTVVGVPVAQANQLLCASYQIYKHSRTNEMKLRTVSYALPEGLHPLVETVAPTTYFASPRTLMLAPLKHSSEESAVVVNATSGELVRAIDTPITTPAILRTLYKTSAYVPTAAGYNALAILGLQNDNPSQDDLADFMIEYREDALGATFQVVPVHGGIYDPNPPGVETSVDIQYTSAITYPTPQIFYCTGGPIAWNAKGEPGPEDGYLAWLKYLLDLEHIPPTISISYADPEMLVPQTYATPLCNLFAQLGLRGVSVLIASGDHGVGVGDCLDGAGNVRFYTMFPASCPWVTSVGGTMVIPETALPLSGGGFSEYFGRPNYQNGAVLTYLQNLGNQYAGFYNALGRGVPDISAQSYLFAFILADELEHVSGTSVATPTFAAIVTLLNDYLISTGRHRLGFLNLWLYDRGIAGLNDITSGVNPGCNTPGFTATTGWDPITGLGTPNFERLQLVDACRVVRVSTLGEDVDEEDGRSQIGEIPSRSVRTGGNVAGCDVRVGVHTKVRKDSFENRKGVVALESEASKPRLIYMTCEPRDIARQYKREQYDWDTIQARQGRADTNTARVSRPMWPLCEALQYQCISVRRPGGAVRKGARRKLEIPSNSLVTSKGKEREVATCGLMRVRKHEAGSVCAICRDQVDIETVHLNSIIASQLCDDYGRDVERNE